MVGAGLIGNVPAAMVLSVAVGRWTFLMATAFNCLINFGRRWRSEASAGLVALGLECRFCRDTVLR
jgi:hypothetical protein